MSLVTTLQSKERLLAWVCRQGSMAIIGQVRLFPEGMDPTTFGAYNSDWERYPHLDEPRDQWVVRRLGAEKKDG